MKMKIAKIIRVCTTPPIIAAILMTVLYTCRSDVFVDPAHYWVAIFCLTLLPIMGYPISLMCSKPRRRECQRNLVIILSLLGYAALVIYSLAVDATREELIVFFTYMISVILIAVTAFVFKVKPSGHACGLAGPIATAAYLVDPWCFLGLIVLAAVYWASIRLKRHTFPQLVAGSVIPVATLVILMTIL